MKTQTKEISFHVEEEVLVAQIELSSVLDEYLIRSLGEHLEAEIQTADVVALLIDCSKLTQHVSSQFLGMLVGAQKKARACGITAGVCGLTNFLKTGFEITSLAQVIPAFTSRSVGIDRLRQRSDIWDVPIEAPEPEVSENWFLAWIESTAAAYVALATVLVAGLALLAFWVGRWTADLF